MLSILEDIFLSRQDLMKRERKRNSERGIVMRPNWKYIDPDGTVHMSKTGKKKDCICGEHKE